MTAAGRRPLAALSLRTGFLLLFALIFLLGVAATVASVAWYSGELAGIVGRRLVEREAAYEKSRVLQLLARELTLAQKMASSPLLKSWIADESDAARRSRAIAELEDYRAFFGGRSYFFALAASGNYYYDDGAAAAPPDGRLRPRYTLSRQIPKDTWFYATLRSPIDQSLNVDTDRHLGVTRVWINTTVRDAAGKAVAVTGTGVDLSAVVAAVVEARHPGAANMLLDAGGAIQAHPDVAVIDFASIRKRLGREKLSTLYDLLDTAADRDALRGMLDRLARGASDVESAQVGVEGRARLMGVTYLPEIRWYVVSLLDPAAAAAPHMLPVGVLLIFAALVVVLAVAAVIFNRQVLRRLARLDRFAQRLGAGEGDRAAVGEAAAVATERHDEIGRLAGALHDMAQRIGIHTEELEGKVAERTAELARLAETDFLTGVLNRRGVVERIAREQQRLARNGGALGLLLLDVDHFKRINDRHGHEVGDRVLVHLAAVLGENLRAYDYCARWGGEEFLIGLPEVGSAADVVAVADKLAAAVRALRFDQPENGTQTLVVTVSIGLTIAHGGEGLDDMIARADAALYEAKTSGRDRVVARFPASGRDKTNRAAAPSTEA